MPFSCSFTAACLASACKEGRDRMGKGRLTLSKADATYLGSEALDGRVQPGLVGFKGLELLFDGAG